MFDGRWYQRAGDDPEIKTQKKNIGFGGQGQGEMEPKKLASSENFFGPEFSQFSRY